MKKVTIPSPTAQRIAKKRAALEAKRRKENKKRKAKYLEWLYK